MPAALIESIASLRERLSGARRAGTAIGLVPTMGALHIGHARLIEQARRECQVVAVSIFINPTQFDRADDLARYPRTLAADRTLCDRLGVDVIFAPSIEEMYPSTPQCTVAVGPIADHLCGRFRPGHFRGVATVVLKLLEIVQPDRAYFGEKDAQQLAIVRRLVTDFNIAARVVGVPTVREADGLAVSSRNARLSPEERQSATALYHALQFADRQICDGATDAWSVEQAAAATIPDSPFLKLEYLEVVDSDDMQPVVRIARPVRVAGAMWVGSTRLIDNVLSTPPAVVQS
jgi:pantoate--beta-alanine ligase